MDGYQVAEELRRREGVTRKLLVALTGFGRLEDRERARQAGIDYHFTKPVDLSSLRDLLARA
jgi:CheY-like chemotaxis protein